LFLKKSSIKSGRKRKVIEIQGSRLTATVVARDNNRKKTGESHDQSQPQREKRESSTKRAGATEREMKDSLRLTSPGRYDGIYPGGSVISQSRKGVVYRICVLTTLRKTKTGEFGREKKK